MEKRKPGPKPHGKENKIRLSITIDSELYETVNLLSQLFSHNVSKLISESLRVYIDNVKKSNPGLIKKLVKQSKQEEIIRKDIGNKEKSGTSRRV